MLSPTGLRADEARHGPRAAARGPRGALLARGEPALDVPRGPLALRPRGPRDRLALHPPRELVARKAHRGPSGSLPG